MIWATVTLLALLVSGLVALTATILVKDVRPPTGPRLAGALRWGPQILPAEDTATLKGMPRPVIHIWYPTDAAAHGGCSPWQLWNRLRRARRSRRGDSARLGAPIAAGSQRFPLVIYFPGWPGTRIENHGLACELASHGFIVAGVTYPARLPGTSDREHQAQIEQLERFPDYTSEEAYGLLTAYSTERVRFRARDARWLIDALTTVDASDDSMFARRIDLTRIGMIGFSLGGAVAAETASLDPRLRAVVNIDGRHWGTALYNGVRQPYLYIGEELLIPTEQELAAADPNRRYNAQLDKFDYLQLAANLRRNGGIQVSVMNTSHLDFTDGGSVSTTRRLLRRIFRSHSIDPTRVLVILDACVLAFMQMHLIEQTPALFTDPETSFPEARIELWPPATH